MIHLPDYIILNLCEVVTNNQEYFIHNFSNFYNRMNLKLLLYCSSLCDIRTERYAETEIFIEIK